MLSKVLDAIYPPDASCALCGGTPIERFGLCQACLNRTSPGINAPLQLSAFTYEGAAAEMVTRLKYGHQTHLAKPLALAMAKAISDANWQADVIIPVPLHWTRVWMRGFNQSQLLAKEVAEICQIKMLPYALKRTRRTPAQAGLKRRERMNNLNHAFCVGHDINVKNLDLILVDDVTTTGATASACFHVLRQSGAKKVRLLTACHAEYE